MVDTHCFPGAFFGSSAACGALPEAPRLHGAWVAGILTGTCALDGANDVWLCLKGKKCVCVYIYIYKYLICCLLKLPDSAIVGQRTHRIPERLKGRNRGALNRWGRSATLVKDFDRHGVVLHEMDQS